MRAASVTLTLNLVPTDPYPILWQLLPQNPIKVSGANVRTPTSWSSSVAVDAAKVASGARKGCLINHLPQFPAVKSRADQRLWSERCNADDDVNKLTSRRGRTAILKRRVVLYWASGSDALRTSRRPAKRRHHLSLQTCPSAASHTPASTVPKTIYMTYIPDSWRLHHTHTHTHMHIVGDQPYNEKKNVLCFLRKTKLPGYRPSVYKFNMYRVG